MKQEKCMRKAILLAFAFCLCLAMLTLSACGNAKTADSGSDKNSVNAANQAVNATKAAKTMDIYLIAGQSNAAGYSLHKNALSETFDNVWYAGQCDKALKSSETKQNWLTVSAMKRSVTYGYGCNESHIGPEYGIAKVINKYYTGENKALIFKSAAGGTGLHDVSGSGSASYGNWYPRSLWQSGYTPKIDGTATSTTGVQYMLFVENFKIVYNNLITLGYTPVIKGMAWMQGEDDLGTNDYDTLLHTFIEDIRRDLMDITGDTKVSSMPFVIGKIATTFSSYNNALVPAMNEMQEKAARDTYNAATVETSDLIIVDEGDVVKGSDRYHFNVNDAVTLGERFGTKLYEMECDANGRMIASCNKGSVSASFDESTKKITLQSFAPDRGYVLSTVNVNGKTVFVSNGGNDLDDGKLIIDVNDIDATALRYNVTVNFIMQKYLLDIKNDNDCGTVVKSVAALMQPIDTEITLTVTPKAGKKIKSVKFDGVVLTPDSDGKYVITITDGANVFEVEYENDLGSGGETAEPAKGCKSSVSYGSAAAVAAILFFAAALMAFKKRTIG